MVKTNMICFTCGIKFKGTVEDMYETGDGNMVVPLCKEHKPKYVLCVTDDVNVSAPEVRDPKRRSKNGS